MPKYDKKVALITGANKGIGFETARQLGGKGIAVILSARDKKRGEDATAQLKKQGIDAHFQLLDVANVKSIKLAVASIREKFGRLDILVNNAGVLLDRETSAMEVSPEVVAETMQTNVYGPFFMIQACLPLMKEGGYGRIVNLS